ncbi:hypothetical protein PPL_01586 [Heterostelium album PN500]|uniref:MaoC-like domain-containing protein n=1 Tax=Heterostelium pallidum (strain ATCC 26659 / Pp 5 / PN500) TaxID=670386 RepID=D3AZX2_HETP5|nr:hypothetical protein PPL_01586 [Heterostelium album PN500]EFA84596.1 hypothetical protein PPL_01586 [Heterostelium album PN500]|eukprot:XP_020436709.1 hypothetical protein PPL_01586 [Heterostelium album PN500]
MNFARKSLNINVGDVAQLTKRFGENEVRTFAELSGDFNPIHLNKEYAATTRFKKPIIHGILVSSMLSSAVATQLPGPGSIYIKQELNFLKPAYVGNEIRAEVKVESIKGQKVTLDTKCIAICHETGKETVVISGPAIVYHPDIDPTKNN